MNRSIFRLAIAMLMLTLVGCAGSVQILSPQNGAELYEPQPIKLKIHSDSKAATFKVTSKGLFTDEIRRNSFAPAPQPGATVMALPVFGLPPTDGFFLLSARADWVNPSSHIGGPQGESIRFKPPAIEADPDYFSMPEEETKIVRVKVPVAPRTQLEITVEPKKAILGVQSRDVSLNNKPAGDSIIVIIPNNSREASFEVHRISSQDTVYLHFTAKGYSTGYATAYIPGRAPIGPVGGSQ